MPSSSDRTSSFIRTSELLYGDRFGAKLARGLEVDQSLIAKVVGGTRAVTDNLEWRLEQLVLEEISRRRSDLAALEQLETNLNAARATPPLTSLPRDRFTLHRVTPRFQIYHGDSLDVLSTLADKSVQACITSPPFYRLRDYKDPAQIGQEGTLEEYLSRLMSVFGEVHRILRDDGTLWVNIADSYADRPMDGGVKRKDLLAVPYELALRLRRAGWHFRQDIIWSKPNGFPESVRDRFTHTHEYLMMFSKSERYYFDADEAKEPALTGARRSSFARGKTAEHQLGRTQRNRSEAIVDQEPGLRTRRSVWSIPTSPSPHAHLAAFPKALVEPCIRAGSPVGGMVLDPFAGSGTTGIVAEELGRRCLGVELNAEYIAIAKQRTEPALARHGDRVEVEGEL